MVEFSKAIEVRMQQEMPREIKIHFINYQFEKLSRIVWNFKFGKAILIFGSIQLVIALDFQPYFSAYLNGFWNSVIR